MAFYNHNPGPIDGVFGAKTDQAVKQFQARHGLLVDGIAGPQTFAKLEEVMGMQARPARNVQLSPNFNEWEFRCGLGQPCCGRVILHPVLVQRLQMLRDRLGRPITINSGYRCPAYNQRIGGAPQSLHMQGMAADIVVAGVPPVQVAAAAEQVGFGGIKAYTGMGFTHVDIGPHRRW